MSNADVVANETIPAALIHPSPVQPGRPWAGILLALLGAIAFSGKAIIVKLGYRYGADAVTLLALRMLVALPFFALMAAWVRRDAQRFRLRGSDRWKVVGLGFCGYYLASFLDFAGLEFITATLERHADKPASYTYISFEASPEANWAIAGKLLDEAE